MVLWYDFIMTDSNITAQFGRSEIQHAKRSLARDKREISDYSRRKWQVESINGRFEQRPFSMLRNVPADYSPPTDRSIPEQCFFSTACLLTKWTCKGHGEGERERPLWMYFKKHGNLLPSVPKVYGSSAMVRIRSDEMSESECSDQSALGTSN